VSGSPDYRDPAARRELGRRVAPEYGKHEAAFVTSGAAALEVALRHVGVRRGDRVAVPDASCHEVPAAVVRLGAIPVIVPVAPGLVLAPQHLERAAARHLRAVIAVHEHGVPCDVAALRRELGPAVAIVEDAAQAWRLRARGDAVGAHSDVVVTSFGFGKPVSIDDGGAAFGDDPGLELLVDRWSAPQRLRAHPVLPYALSHHALAHLPAALERADVLLERRRRFVAWAVPLLESAGLDVWTPQPGDVPTWRYVPIAVAPRDVDRYRDAPEAGALGIVRPHPVALAALPMLAGRAVAIEAERDPREERCWIFVPADHEEDARPALAAWLRRVR
jgi:perosamine synthetase